MMSIEELKLMLKNKEEGSFQNEIDSMELLEQIVTAFPEYEDQILAYITNSTVIDKLVHDENDVEKIMSIFHFFVPPRKALLDFMGLVEVLRVEPASFFMNLATFFTSNSHLEFKDFSEETQKEGNDLQLGFLVLFTNNLHKNKYVLGSNSSKFLGELINQVIKNRDEMARANCELGPYLDTLMDTAKKLNCPPTLKTLTTSFFKKQNLDSKQTAEILEKLPAELQEEIRADSSSFKK